MLTDSGGAVAVLSFMGASDKVREMVGPRIALGCFSLGVICTGILVAKQFHRFERVFTGYRKEAQEYLADQIEWGGTHIERQQSAQASSYGLRF